MATEQRRTPEQDLFANNLRCEKPATDFAMSGRTTTWCGKVHKETRRKEATPLKIVQEVGPEEMSRRTSGDRNKTQPTPTCIQLACIVQYDHQYHTSTDRDPLTRVSVVSTYVKVLTPSKRDKSSSRTIFQHPVARVVGTIHQRTILAGIAIAMGQRCRGSAVKYAQVTSCTTQS